MPFIKHPMYSSATNRFSKTPSNNIQFSTQRSTMVRHGTAKKRRSGVKVTRKQQKPRNARIVSSIVNQDIKVKYDKKKSPKENLESFGLVFDANNLENESSNKGNRESAAFLGFAKIVEGETFVEKNPKRKTISEVDAEYAQLNINKHGTNYKAMERDIISNNRQYTDTKMQKLCEKYLLSIE